MDDDDDMPEDLEHELRRIHREIHRIREHMIEILINPGFELDIALSALDDLKALGARIDAVAALLPTDAAQAAGAQKAIDDAANAANVAALAAAQVAATQAESDLAAEVTSLTAKVVALEAAAGVPIPPAALILSTTSASFAAGVASSLPLTVTGGTAPYTLLGAPTGISYDGSNLNGDASTVAGSTSATITDFTDSSTPALTASLTITVT